MTHVTTKNDPDTGDPVRDERDRIVYRIRKHDLEEFECIAARYGLWKRDLERFAKAIAIGRQQRLPIEAPESEAAPARTH